ncbi:hypothetical protein [Methylobacterium organophilum]|uniref:Uncharacterized protein n=1 Tax=Methylobacterium organophilum TaxID=410 RepID=A0ABQ4T928_METOR|nr:hypothetical protein [Methylobacterium organophilum]UMY16694.1 hypothetical protein MMB17_18705 [Methylobacterium organophilum]GJE27380.1 hypothetical protein LKMONMHP_2239 [Methylobacterium organophilum]
MKRLVAAGLVTLLGLSAAVAEPQPPGPPGGPPPGPAEGARPEGPRRGPPEGERDGGFRPPPPPPRMPETKGAHLRFHRGETGLDFKCAAEDSTKACVDALMPLVDKLLQPR